MSENNQQQISDEASTEKLETKKSIREKVWQELLTKRQSAFPLPAFGRIPNFKGAREAAAKLLDIPEFKSAQSVEVNPDKPLEPCRKLVLEQGKHLYVPVPQLRGGLLKKLEVTEKHELHKIASRWGIEQLGKEINLNDHIHIDLLIVGSVAVSKEGYRIGKGKGYADLEFAVLKEMKAVNDDTVIITVVHDIQVFDKLPSDLFQIYDVPIDIIVTPTEIIRVEKKLPKPKGIYWNILTFTQVKKIDILKNLREKHESEGKDVTLRTKNENNGKKPFYKRRYPTRSWKQRPKTNPTNEVNNITNPNGKSRALENETKVENLNKDNNETSPRNNETSPESKSNKGVQNRDKRHFKERRTYRRNTEETMHKENENNENIPPKNKKIKKLHDGYSLCVSNIERSVRVSDLKSALQEKGIRPNFIVWKGFKGFCYLHYTTKKKDPDNQESFAIDNIIEKIQGIKINPTRDRNLDVEVMDPITRIETVNVTSV